VVGSRARYFCRNLTSTPRYARSKARHALDAVKMKATLIVHRYLREPPSPPRQAQTSDRHTFARPGPRPRVVVLECKAMIFGGGCSAKVGDRNRPWSLHLDGDATACTISARVGDGRMAFTKAGCPLVIARRPRARSAAWARKSFRSHRAGDPVVMYGGLTSGQCRACRRGAKQSVRKRQKGGWAFQPRWVCPRSSSILPVAPSSFRFRAGVDCAMPPAPRSRSSTVEHMLFDNAKLEPGETIWSMPAAHGIGHCRRSRWRRRSAAL